MIKSQLLSLYNGLDVVFVLSIIAFFCVTKYSYPLLHNEADSANVRLAVHNNYKLMVIDVLLPLRTRICVIAQFILNCTSPYSYCKSLHLLHLEHNTDRGRAVSNMEQHITISSMLALTLISFHVIYFLFFVSLLSNLIFKSCGES
jgi:hypothetical protein